MKGGPGDAWRDPGKIGRKQILLYHPEADQPVSLLEADPVSKRQTEDRYFT